MNRFAKLTLAAAALSLTALSAVPASAEVVVSLRGKTADQVTAEIQVAAVKVCRAELARVPLSSLSACAADVVQDTMSQLPATFGK